MNIERLIELGMAQLVQVTVVIALVAVMTKLVGRGRPHLVYALWVLVLVKCLTPPVFSSRVGVFSWAHAQQRGGERVSVVQRVSRAPELAPAVMVEAREKRVDSVAPVTVLGAPMTHETWKINWMLVMVSAWGAGVMGIVAIIAVRSRRIRRQIHGGAVEATEEVTRVVEEVRGALAMRRGVEVVVSREPIGPAVFGVWRPVLVLPEVVVKGRGRRGCSSRQLSTENQTLTPTLSRVREREEEGDAGVAPTGRGCELREVVAHELIHVRRGDHWVAALELLAAAIWWFHPLVWWMNRRIDQARELCCDEEVIASLRSEPAVYGQMLLDVLRLRRELRPVGLALGVRAVQVTGQRLEHIMSDSKRFNRRMPWTWWVVAGVLGLIILPGAGLALQEKENPAKTQATPATQPTAKALSFVGQVVDKETKKPIEGATVVIHREVARHPTKWDKFAPDTEVMTDKDGKFTIDVPADQVAEKQFCLATEVRHPKYASLAWEGEGLSLMQAEMKKGEDPWFEHLAMAPGEEVTGTVEDPQGKTLAGCEVEFRSMAGDERTAGLKMGNDLAMGSVKTDANGRFTFTVLKGAKLTGMWLKPEQYAISYEQIGEKRGELGRFWVKPGAVVSGTLVDEKGKALGGVEVSLESKKRVLAFCEETDRATKTDENGKFALAPVIAGSYELHVGDSRFMTLGVEVSEGTNQTLALKPAELVNVRLKFVNSAGKPAKQYAADFAGWKNQEWYHTEGETSNKQGVMEFHVPKLDKAEIMIVSYGGYPVQWRRGEKRDWEAGQRIKLEPLNEDVTDLTVMESKAATVKLTVVGPDGKALSDYVPKVQYVDESARLDKGISWMNGSVGDVNWQKRKDGTRETEDLLPGRDFVLSVEAKGCAPVEQKLKLKEGEKKDVQVVMKVATAKS